MKPRISTMNVSLPAPLRARLDQKVHELGAYGSTSEYIRELIRRDLARDALSQLDALITQGVHSGPSVPVTPAWWKDRHAALARHRRERAKKGQRKRV